MYYNELRNNLEVFKMKAGTQFFNKHCPICDHIFHRDDNVIVCPECDRPHHEKCWHKNHGCGLLDCEGGKVHKKDSPEKPEKDAKKTSVEQDVTMPCPVCEADIESGSIHCPYCESRLKRKAFFKLLQIVLILIIIGAVGAGGWLVIQWAIYQRPPEREPESVQKEEQPTVGIRTPREHTEKLWMEEKYGELRYFLESEELLNTDPDFYYPYLIGVYLLQDNVEDLIDHIDTFREILPSQSFDFFAGLIYAADEQQRQAREYFLNSKFSFHTATDSLADIIKALPEDMSFEYYQEQLYIQGNDTDLFEQLQQAFNSWQWRIEEGYIHGKLIADE